MWAAGCAHRAASVRRKYFILSAYAMSDTYKHIVREAMQRSILASKERHGRLQSPALLVNFGLLGVQGKQLWTM